MTIADSHRPHSKLIRSLKRIGSLLIIAGNSLTAIGCIELVLALIDIIEMDFFAIGISSRMRA